MQFITFNAYFAHSEKIRASRTGDRRGATMLKDFRKKIGIQWAK